MTCISGDSRRPYPTEIEMRQSLLAKLGDLSQNISTTGHPNVLDHSGKSLQFFYHLFHINFCNSFHLPKANCVTIMERDKS